MRWPHLQFADRAVYVATLRDVWISGNDGVVTDGTCWLDSSILTGTSTVRLQLTAPAHVAYYQLFTNKNSDKRDPTSWQFGIVRSDGSFELLATETDYTPPTARSPAAAAARTLRHCGDLRCHLE